MDQLIKEGIERNFFSHLDLYFAKLMVDELDFSGEVAQASPLTERVKLLIALISRAYTRGHVTFPRKLLLEPHRWFLEGREEERRLYLQALEAFFEEAIDTPHFWNPAIEALPPAIKVTEEGLYLLRNFEFETQIVEYLLEGMELPEVEQNQLKLYRSLMERYAPKEEGEFNYQRLAAANTLLQPLSIISGGPGTGKTTTVFNILLMLAESHFTSSGRAPIIRLAAPTGKAAGRLKESIEGQRMRMSNVDHSVLSAIPSESHTLHRLLGIRPLNGGVNHHRHNPLPLDILVVDEASMIDINTFILLIEALPKEARLILLGDKDQLSSVEAGSVMHELCRVGDQTEEGLRYSPKRVEALEYLLEERLPKALSTPSESGFYADYLTLLQVSYRFGALPRIEPLAKLINEPWQQNTLFKAKRLLEQNDDELAHYPLPMEESALLEQINSAFSDYLAILQEPSATVEEIFATFNKARILAIQRKGRYGVEALNHLIEEQLFNRERGRSFYHGLAIMIEQNDADYGLYNGDVGLILEREEGLRAYFEHREESYSIHTLPKHEVAFAMTVHKSQGSEFDHVLLFLAEQGSPFITKELFYTGITRTKKRVTLFAGESALWAGLSQRTTRFSFIYEGLVSGAKSRDRSKK